MEIYIRSLVIIPLSIESPLDKFLERVSPTLLLLALASQIRPTTEQGLQVDLLLPQTFPVFMFRVAPLVCKTHILLHVVVPRRTRMILLCILFHDCRKSVQHIKLRFHTLSKL
jgi:hypothetical protein